MSGVLGRFPAVECLNSFGFATQKAHEFLPGGEVIEHTAEVARGGDGVLFLHATHLHAHVLCLDDDDDAEGIECLLDTVLDLRRQTLLHLQATSEDVDDAGELRQPRLAEMSDSRILPTEILQVQIRRRPWTKK